MINGEVMLWIAFAMLVMITVYILGKLEEHQQFLKDKGMVKQFEFWQKREKNK